MIKSNFTEDSLLGGKLILRQPKKGFRVSIDTVLLASAVAASNGERVFEPGAGHGGAALCLAQRLPNIIITGMEINSESVAFALENIKRNGFQKRVQIHLGDVRCQNVLYEEKPFQHVMINPPYLETAEANIPPDKNKATANFEGKTNLSVWIKCAYSALERKGSLTLIYRTDHLDKLLQCLSEGFGNVILIPLWRKKGEPAKRIIIKARKDVKTKLTLTPGVVLHKKNGAFTSVFQNILQGAALSS